MSKCFFFFRLLFIIGWEICQSANFFFFFFLMSKDVCPFPGLPVGRAAPGRGDGAAGGRGLGLLRPLRRRPLLRLRRRLPGQTDQVGRHPRRDFFVPTHLAFFFKKKERPFGNLFFGKRKTIVTSRRDFLATCLGFFFFSMCRPDGTFFWQHVWDFFFFFKKIVMLPTGLFGNIFGESNCDVPTGLFWQHI